MRNGLSGVRRIIFSASVTALVMWVLLYAPTPYVVYEPGIAVPIEPMISLASGQPADKGQLLLTAVKLTEPNFWHVLKASVDGDKDVYSKDEVFGSYTKQQYSERLTVIMEGSQNDALEAAYRYLNVPYERKIEAIVVSDVLTIAGKPAGRLRAGDRLIGLRGGPAFTDVKTAAEAVMKALREQANTKDGTVMVTAQRGGEQLDIELKADLVDNVTSKETPQQFAELLGVKGFTELRSIKAENRLQELHISTDEIGGPSAGLVFALGAVNLLTEGDLTGGVKIAATGTITPEGKVGVIGGIMQKVVSTDQNGAELFLVPKGNEADAKSKARKMGTSMEIVGVESLEEAMDAIASFLKRR
ncbi:S16 family serine protease [Paenibacillus nanensis]|nr:S16 family serine protease [Paenibacillus nanensis]